MITKKFKPSDIVTVDFETYWSSDYSLSAGEYNTSEYVRDPQFKVQCIGIKDGTKKAKWYPEKEGRRVLNSIDWRRRPLLSHNTAFDGFILSEHYKIVPCFYLDTLSMTRALHGDVSRASLDVIARLYEVGMKSKTYLAPTKGIRDLPPKVLKALGEGCVLDIDLCFEVFKKQHEVYPIDELNLIDLTIRMFCDPVLKVDIPLATRAHEIEVKKRQEAIELSGATEKELNSNEKFANKLRELGVEPPTKVSTSTGHETYAFAKTDFGFIDLQDHEDIRVVRLMEGRLAAKSTIGETRAKRLIKAGENNKKLPIMLNYSAAKTHRWSGGNKMNSQNFPRAEFDDNNNLIPDSDILRRSIIAPSGHVIVVVDSSQIELRTNNWLAGNKEKLEIIRAYDAKTGPDPYRLLASDVYNIDVEDITKSQRFVGKVGELGLGYQMGGKKFQTTLALGTMGPPVQMSLNECLGVVRVYRRNNKPITEQWKNLTGVLKDLAHGRSGTYGPNDILEYEDYAIWGPNGMCLNYPGLVEHFNPDTEKVTGYSYLRHGAKAKIYGGLLCENIVQWLARNIVAEQMLEIAEKYRVVMMTHDEVACVVPKRQAEKALEYMLKCMKTPRKWCPDIPLNAEGGFDVCYSK